MISIKEKGQGIRFRGKKETVYLTARAVGHGVFIADVEVHREEGIENHEAISAKALDIKFSSFSMTTRESSGQGWLASVIGLCVVDGPRKLGLETIKEELKRIGVQESSATVKKMAAGFTFGASAGGIVCVEELPTDFGPEMCHGYKLGINFARFGPKYFIERDTIKL